MYCVNYSLLGFCLFSKQDDFHISGKEIFIKVANHVSLSTISDSKIMTSLFHLSLFQQFASLKEEEIRYLIITHFRDLNFVNLE